jgi:hypothetical protein
MAAQAGAVGQKPKQQNKHYFKTNALFLFAYLPISVKNHLDFLLSGRYA